MVGLSVVLLQYEAGGRYPRALRRLLAVLDRLRSVELSLLLVDNVREGDWRHEISGDVLQIGGDNSAWEFSAFDRGLEVLAEWRPETELVVLVTDAFQAYGEEYVDLIDDGVVESASRLGACVGWMDSFGFEECRIGELAYDTWIRTSFVFLPPAALARVRPLAADLEPLNLFSGSPEAPFLPDARVSENLRQLLLEWLTTHELAQPRLAERWHSRFELTGETLAFFQAKVGSILREHLLSARLRAAGVPCYDYRCLRFLANQGQLDAFLEQGGDPDLQWLGWRSLLGGRTALAAVAAASATGPAAGEAQEERPALVLAGEIHASQRPEAAFYLLDKVVPLIQQRYAAVRLVVAGASESLAAAESSMPDSLTVLPSLDELRRSGLLDDCVAIVAPPRSDSSCLDAVKDLVSDRRPLVATREILATDPPVAGPVLRADSATELAAACCRTLAARLERAAAGPSRVHAEPAPTGQSGPAAAARSRRTS